MPNYNYIVWLYDALVWLVFGNKLEQAKKEHLSYIANKSKILVVGGGTGTILNYLNDLDFNLEVDYVDISSQMLRQAQKRRCEKLAIKFYEQSILDYSIEGYDIIIVNFFFDQFKQPLAQELLNKIRQKLKTNGVLLFSDFVNSRNAFNRILLFTMISFLRLTAMLKTERLPDYDLLFLNSGFVQKRESTIGNYIRTGIYSLSE